MNWAVVLASCYTIVELFLNGSFIVGGLHEEVSYLLKKSYQEIYLYEKNPINVIREEDNEFCRIGEELTYIGSNFGFIFNYAGTDYFASTFNYPVNSFLSKMGKADTYYMTGIKGVEPFTLSCLGIKYIVSPWEICDGIYNKVACAGGDSSIKTYVNENACSIGFLADKKYMIRDEQLNRTVYENANSFSTMLSGNEERIYTNIKMNVEGKEILKNDGAYRLSLSFDTDLVGDYYLDIDGMWNKVPSKVQYGQEKPRDFQTEELQNVCRDFNIELDGETVYRGGYTQQFQRGYYLGGILETGHHEIVIFASDYLHLNSISLYHQNKDTLIQKLKCINSRSIQDLSKTKNGLSGRVTPAEQERLVISVPFDQGWTAYIDGKETDIIPAFGTFLSIDVPNGEHIVEFVYLPRGFAVGCILSVFSLLTIVTYFGLKRKQNVNIS